MTHELKTALEPFQAALEGRKPYEIRVADRPFNVGDILLLQEWSMNLGYTGRALMRRVSYITRPGEWGLPPNLCVLGLGFIESAGEQR